MCFSAQASFMASAFLLPIGISAIIKAYKNDKAYLFFAMIPLIFGLHQIIEGLIWLNIGHSSAELRVLALAYTFIAFFLWPFFIPYSLYLLEPQLKRQIFLKKISFFALAYSFIVYLPILVGYISLKVSVVENGLSYLVNLPLWLQHGYVFFYIVIIGSSFLIGSRPSVSLFGGLLIVSFILSLMWYYYTFSSTWCYFSAVLSAFVYLIIPSPTWIRQQEPN